MKNPLLSIIVPVYNVKPFLRKCVESLVNQTYTNIEVILVDDGSTDDSGVYCDELAKEFSEKTIKVIHKVNGGLSDARNTGLLQSTGEFVCFIDSDDWIDLRTYEYCINSILKYNADIIQFDYVLTKRQDFKATQEKDKILILEGKNILQYYMEDSTKSGSYSMCRVVFRKSLSNGLLFRVGKLNEDIDYKYELLSKAAIMVCSNQIFYYYRQGNVSISSGGLKQTDFDLYEAANILWDLAKNEEYGTIRSLAKLKKDRTAFSLLAKIAFFGFKDQTMEREVIIEELTKEHRKNLKTLLFSPMPLIRKICAVLLAININCLKYPLLVVKKLNLTKL